MESFDPGAGGGGQGGPGGGGHPDPGHVHGATCGCSEEFKRQDPTGMDLFDSINIDGI